MATKIIFFKGTGTFFDKITRLWTRGKYSHCEIWIDGYTYTSSYREKGVHREYKKKLNISKWDVVDLHPLISSSDEIKIIDFYLETKDHGYDTLGVFCSQIFSKNIENKNKWFCSEWCATALNEPYTLLNPTELFYQLQKRLNLINKNILNRDQNIEISNIGC